MFPFYPSLEKKSSGDFPGYNREKTHLPVVSRLEGITRVLQLLQIHRLAGGGVASCRRGVAYIGRGGARARLRGAGGMVDLVSREWSKR